MHQREIVVAGVALRGQQPLERIEDGDLRSDHARDRIDAPRADQRLRVDDGGVKFARELDDLRQLFRRGLRFGIEARYPDLPKTIPSGHITERSVTGEYLMARAVRQAGSEVTVELRQLRVELRKVVLEQSNARRFCSLEALLDGGCNRDEQRRVEPEVRVHRPVAQVARRDQRERIA